MSSCCPISGSVTSKDIATNNFAAKAGTVCNLCVSNLTVTNTITTPAGNNQICTLYPLIGDGTTTNCVDITPGFCGSILQNINGAWGVYRSPGITEITVGGGGNGVPPGANFPDVASALGSSLATNCRFIRITDDTTDGPTTLNLPSNTLIYIDPGVTWTVLGNIQMNGDFVLLGNQSFPSSRVIFGGTPFIAPAYIIGNGNLIVRHLHFQHAPQTNPNELLVDPSIPSQFFDVVVELGNTQGGFLSDASTAFANMTLDHVTLIGGGPLCSGAITIGQAISRFASHMLTIQGTFDLGLPTLLCFAPSALWQGIRVQQDGQLVLTGTISDVFQITTGALTVNLAPEAIVTNITVDHLVLSIGNVKVSNFLIQTLDVTSTSLGYLLTNGVIGEAIINNDLRLPINSQISNVSYQGIVALISSLVETCMLSNFLCPNAGLTVNLTESAAVANPKRVQISNLHVGGALLINMRSTAGVFMNPNSIVEIDNSFIGGLVDIDILVAGNTPSAVCYFTNSKVSGDFTFNRQFGTDPFFRQQTLIASNLQILGNLQIGGNVGGLSTGVAILDNLQISGTGSVLLDYDASYCSITNFTCAGNFSWLEVQTGELANGSIGGNFQFGSGGFNANHKATNISCSNDVTIATSNGQISNLICLGGGTSDLVVSGTNNIISGVTNTKAPVSVNKGGTITVNGANNTISNVRAQCSVVINGNGTIFSDSVILGTQWRNGIIDTAAQQFLVNGNNSIINDVILGNPVFVNAGNPPGVNFTDGGFGSSSDGTYAIRFGAAGVTNLQVNNLSIFPRTAQTGISIANAAGAPGTIQFLGEYSNYENVRIWFFPGGISTSIPVTALTPSLNSTVTIGAANQIMRSGFSNWRIGYGNEVGASANPFPTNNIGTLSIFAADLLLTNIFSNRFIVNAIVGTANQTFTTSHCLDAAGSSFAVTATPSMIVTACRNFTTIAGYGTIPVLQTITNT